MQAGNSGNRGDSQQLTERDMDDRQDMANVIARAITVIEMEIATSGSTYELAVKKTHHLKALEKLGYEITMSGYNPEKIRS